MAKDQFTLQDFLEQMQQIKKMGSMKGLLGMLPGVGQMKKQLEEFDEKEITRTEAIIYSMTPLERTQPKVLNGARRMRIARGSGTSVTEVNQLIARFEQAAKMMKTVAKGGMPNIPGTNPALMGGGGFSGGKKKIDQKKKGSKSGNPAKRALGDPNPDAASSPARPSEQRSGASPGDGRNTPKRTLSRVLAGHDRPWGSLGQWCQQLGCHPKQWPGEGGANAFADEASPSSRSWP
jgi:signal recognition particle subunit SRP54